MNEDDPHRWERSRVEQALVTLTANLLRVTRGAGRPHTIAEEAAELVEAYNAYRALDPRPLDVGHLLDWKGEHLTPGLNAAASGALQLVASRLLGQYPQELAGERQMLSGMETHAALAPRGEPQEEANPRG